MAEQDLQAVEAISAVSPEAAQWGLSAYRMLLAERARGRVLVAEQDGVVVGFLCFRILGSEAEVLNLAVLPSCRRRGAGSQMLEQTIQEVSEGGATRLFLEVRKSNVPAIRLYERHGFSPAGLRPGYYKDPPDDAVVLARDLRAASGVERS
jgi:ribosomal-protein-alanine N-acetyltransferase